MKSKVGVSYNKFYISGGTASMKGLSDFLNTSLNVDFVTLDPFIKMNQRIYLIHQNMRIFWLALRNLEKE